MFYNFLTFKIITVQQTQLSDFRRSYFRRSLLIISQHQFAHF